MQKSYSVNKSNSGDSEFEIRSLLIEENLPTKERGSRVS